MPLGWRFGSWQNIEGGFVLMQDRLGIIVTADAPNKWHVGQPIPGTSAQEPTGVLHGIESMANPAAAPGAGVPHTAQQFWLRLTTVIEGDFGIEATAPGARHRRCRSRSSVASTPTITFTMTWSTEARRFRRARATRPLGCHCRSRRFRRGYRARLPAPQAAHEFPPLTASVEIPFLVGYINVGDRISQINGCTVSLF